MAIIIENFECTDSLKVQQTKNDIDKQKYLKFLLEKGIEECAGIAMAHRSLKRQLENSALSVDIDTNHIEFLESNIFYYDTILPAVIAGDYESVERFSVLSAEDLQSKSREIRRSIIARLDEKYGHLF